MDLAESLRGQLVVKAQSLVDCKVECHLAKVKAKVLNEQKEHLETKNSELKQQLVCLLETTIVLFRYCLFRIV